MQEWSMVTGMVAGLLEDADVPNGDTGCQSVIVKFNVIDFLLDLTYYTEFHNTCNFYLTTQGDDFATLSIIREEPFLFLKKL